MKVCIELSYCYLKGKLLEFVDKHKITRNHTSYACVIVDVNSKKYKELNILTKNLCTLSVLDN